MRCIGTKATWNLQKNQYNVQDTTDGCRMVIQTLKTHKLLVASLAFFLILFSFGTWSYFRQARQLEMIAPKYGPIVEAIYGLGKVKSDRQYEVKIGIVSTVRKIYVREGDKVKEGDPLITFDTSSLFRAPFAGTITLVAFQELQPVFAQQPIIRLEDLNNRYIEVSLEQQGALRVRNGQSVSIVFESLRGEKLIGQVTALFPRNDEFLAHIKVKDLPDNVMPGMTADLAIEVGKKDNALLLPLTGISNGQVIRVRDGKKQKVEVKIGKVDGNWAELLEGDVIPTDFIAIKRKK
jgi:membrane fusion protein, macrolide-specific efflux system